MPTNKELEVIVSELEQRIIALEVESVQAQHDQVAQVSPVMFYDMLIGVIESLVRANSSGAYSVAATLRDKYLDPEVSLSEFGQRFVSSQSLY